jgi:hypothetical protein
MRSLLPFAPLVGLLSALGACAPQGDGGDPSTQAAASDVPSTALYLGSLTVGNGMRAKLLRVPPPGNPLYVLDLPNPPGDHPPGSGCSISTLYGLPNDVTDDVDAQVAAIANPQQSLPTPGDECRNQPCKYEPAWTGPQASWGPMDAGIRWDFADAESLRIVLKPTAGIATGGLRIEAICRGIDNYW